MRIVFLVNRDIESNFALNLLLPELHQSTVGIFLSERVGASRPVSARMLGQLAFIEQDLFNDLVFSLPKRLDQARLPLCRIWGFSAALRHSRESARGLEGSVGATDATDMRADLFVSIRFGKILHAEVFGMPHLGVLNLHSGLLPQYRGVLATFRALLNGDVEIGCTFHWIDSPGIDIGRHRGNGTSTGRKGALVALAHPGAVSARRAINRERSTAAGTSRASHRNAASCIGGGLLLVPNG